VSIVAKHYDGIFHIAASLPLGVTLKDVPPGIGIRQDVLAQYGPAVRG
jgi:hypothetical protein